ncbi:MAG: ATP-dependent helicase HrpB, partial [Candidatus Sericytochromatia bacterium]
PVPANTRELEHSARVIRQTLARESGSLLVFLPGAGEIRRLVESLSDLPPEVLLAPLYGDLPPAAQDQAIAPPEPGRRKLVLATNIAETSLTIEGVRVVIDSGLARVPVFDLVSGMTRLETRPISRASAEQRAGRAGRLEPGLCLRLWPESETARLAAGIPPEILSADLAPLVLELALWGTSDPESLVWLDPPTAAAWKQASELLQALEAIDAHGRISAHGKALARLPLAPRLGHMVLRAKSAGLGGLACTLAALLAERDPLAGVTRDSDLILRLQALAGKRQVPGRRREQILQAAGQIGDKLGLRPAFAPVAEAGRLIALAYPERIAQRRPGGEARYLLANGRGALLDAGDSLARESWLAIAQLDGNPREARIFLAAGLSPEQLENLTAAQTQEKLDISYDRSSGRVQARRQLRYGALVLSEKAIDKPDAGMLVQALLVGVRQRGLAQLPWSTAQQQLRARVDFVARHRPDWPEMADQALEANLETWLAPFLTGLRRIEAIDAGILQQGLEYHIGYSRLTELEALAPSHLTVPTGTKIRLDYAGSDPVLAVRLQELFGMAQTPCVLQGQVPVLIHLLSPAQRPVQVTRDLASFWRETYPEVKKELKGRYPKHYWPDDPLVAEPVRGIKRKKA